MNKLYLETAPNSRKYIFTDLGLSYAKKALSNGISYITLAKEFGINPDTLSHLCHEYGIHKDNRRKYALNERYFQNIDSPEKAYWLGFLCADGCVDKKGHIILTLQEKDRKHVKKFLSAIGSNIIPKRKVVTSNVTTKETIQYEAYVSSAIMAKDLTNAGCPPSKSLILKPPKIVSELNKYWILGYFDGDGCLTSFYEKRDGGRSYFRYRMSFTGTYEVLEYIKTFFGTKSKIVKEHRCNNTYCYHITETKTREFLESIYNTDAKYFSLDRKRNKFFEILDKKREKQNE